MNVLALCSFLTIGSLSWSLKMPLSPVSFAPLCDMAATGNSRSLTELRPFFGLFCCQSSTVTQNATRIGETAVNMQSTAARQNGQMWRLFLLTIGRSKKTVRYRTITIPTNSISISNSIPISNHICNRIPTRRPPANLQPIAAEIATCHRNKNSRKNGGKPLNHSIQQLFIMIHNSPQLTVIHGEICCHLSATRRHLTADDINRLRKRRR